MVFIFYVREFQEYLITNFSFGEASQPSMVPNFGRMLTILRSESEVEYQWLTSVLNWYFIDYERIKRLSWSECDLNSGRKEPERILLNILSDVPSLPPFNKSSPTFFPLLHTSTHSSRHTHTHKKYRQAVMLQEILANVKVSTKWIFRYSLFIFPDNLGLQSSEFILPPKHQKCLSKLNIYKVSLFLRRGVCMD